MRKVLVPLVVVLFLVGGNKGAYAQTGSWAVPYALDSSSFPTMTLQFDAWDGSGNFISGLTAGQISLQEDKSIRTPTSLTEIQPGVGFVVVLDPAPMFAYQDVRASTRLSKIDQALEAWAASHSDAHGDDLSLVATGSTPATHLSSSAAFSAALSAFKPNLQHLVPNLNSLSQALDTASEASAQPGMKKVVLYIASPPDPTTIPVLENLIQRAVQFQVRVNVWIVTSQAYFTTSGATALKDLAIRTGGQYTLYSGTENLPDPESYLDPLRHAYRLSYNSAVRTPGGHTLSIQISSGGEVITSTPLSFTLDVEPPNPIPVNPPSQIVRQGSNPLDLNLAAYPPTTQTINILVEFPDNHKRALVSTALFVDGRKMAENTRAPFDSFTWSLSAYTQSAQHILQVQATDSLGLSRLSTGIPVTVTVVQPERGLVPDLERHSRWVALAAVVLAGILLVLILTSSRIRRRLAAARHKAQADPLTQSVKTKTLLPSTKPQRVRKTPLAQAYLVRLRSDGEPVTAPPVQILSQGTTFGSDPFQAEHVLDDPSVSPLHARLTVDRSGNYTLVDEKSASGTWVNFERLKAPHRLQHGDILHIGRISYRFQLRHPPVRPEPRIQPKN
jgi:hypothetical protein